MRSDIVHVLAAVRSPMGAFLGGLSNLPAPEIAARLIAELIRRHPLLADWDALKKESDRYNPLGVVLGQVVTAGAGQAPAKQAALNGGLSDRTPCITVNKVCGSGMVSLQIARLMLREDHDIVIAGGMENMSLAPYLLPKARGGYRFGNGVLVDSMMQDGLVNPYDNQVMGAIADATARENGISREACDDWARGSFQKALDFQARLPVSDEIVSIDIRQRKKTVTIDRDEGPAAFRPEKMDALKPAFTDDGVITAANASTLSDGASLLILANDRGKAALGGESLATIEGFTSHAGIPTRFTEAPISALDAMLNGGGADNINYYEINEAFATVPLLAVKKLNLDPARVNPRGGAISMGHPLGCSGARIVTTMIHALRERGGGRGIAALCIGGGEGMAARLTV